MPVIWNGATYYEGWERRAARGLQRAAIFLTGKVKVSMNISSQRGKNPSEPGMPPHRDTGALVRSVRYDLMGPYEARVGAYVPYAAIHEYGGPIFHPGRSVAGRVQAKGRGRKTKKGYYAWKVSGHEIRPYTVHMPARPYLRPALDLFRDDLAELIAGKK